LNNIVEQDHRFVKRRVKLGLGFGSFPTAWHTLLAYEAIHRLRKGQLTRLQRGMPSRTTRSSTGSSGWWYKERSRHLSSHFVQLLQYYHEPSVTPFALVQIRDPAR
jgi:hypothetical protein